MYRFMASPIVSEASTEWWYTKRCIVRRCTV